MSDTSDYAKLGLNAVASYYSGGASSLLGMGGGEMPATSSSVGYTGDFIVGGNGNKNPVSSSGSFSPNISGDSMILIGAGIISVFMLIYAYKTIK